MPYKDKSKQRVYDQAYRQKNKVYIAARYKKYRKTHKVFLKKMKRRWSQAHKKQVNEYCRLHRKTHKYRQSVKRYRRSKSYKKIMTNYVNKRREYLNAYVNLRNVWKVRFNPPEIVKLAMLFTLTKKITRKKGDPNENRKRLKKYVRNCKFACRGSERILGQSVYYTAS